MMMMMLAHPVAYRTNISCNRKEKAILCQTPQKKAKKKNVRK